MKILVTEVQFDKLISTVTGEPLNGNKTFFSKVLKYFKSDSNIGEMILNSIKKNNYEFDSYGVDDNTYKLEFTISNFPFVLTKERTVFHYKYILYAPLIQSEMEINTKVGDEIFNLLAERYMSIYDYMEMTYHFNV
jgi:hypothetical protein